MNGTRPTLLARVASGALLFALAACGDPSPALPTVPVAPVRADPPPAADAADGSAIVEIEGPPDLLPAVRVRREAEDPAAPGPRVRWSEMPAQRVITVPTPPGFRTSVAASSSAALVWPPWQPLGTGARARIRVEPLREVRLHLPPAVAGRRTDGREPCALVLVDRTVVPPGPPGRVAALDLLAGTGRFGSVVRRADGHLLSPMPPVPCHVLLRHGSDVAWARWDGASPSIELRAAPLRAIVPEPLLGEAPLPAGGVVAPGRLDVAAAAALTGAGARRVEGAFLLRGARPWGPVALPDAPEYTLWHPDRGIAHAAPDATGALVGVPPPGEIVLVAPDGSEISGHAAAWPCWPGDGCSFTRPEDTGLRRTFDRTRAARLRGLPAGTWRLDYAFAAVGGEPGPALHRAEVVLTEASPRATVVVRVEGSAVESGREEGRRR